MTLAQVWDHFVVAQGESAHRKALFWKLEELERFPS